MSLSDTSEQLLGHQADLCKENSPLYWWCNGKTLLLLLTYLASENGGKQAM